MEHNHAHIIDNLGIWSPAHCTVYFFMFCLLALASCQGSKMPRDARHSGPVLWQLASMQKAVLFSINTFSLTLLVVN